MKNLTPANSMLNFRYAQLADDIENKIRKGSYRTGEKLPSLRKLQHQTGFSISTVYQAYIELEKRGIVEPREKSGFYVKPLLKSLLPVPGLQRYRPVPKKVSINAIAGEIVEEMSNPNVLQLGSAATSPELLPYKQLFRMMMPHTDKIRRDIITNYEHPSGMPELRREIAKRTINMPRTISDEDIIITNGCMEAVNICLRAVAGAGDTIIVESPTFHCFLQLIEDLNMFALEMPTHPEEGVDIDALEQALKHHDVKACILIPNFHNPLGFVMGSSRKKALVDCLTRHEIPIIEDDIYGELYMGKNRPDTLVSYDTKGLVLYCSSFSKTLAPGLRIGWTIPGRFTETVRRIKFNTSISSPKGSQYAIAEFLKTGAYDRHLRKLRNALKNQISNMAQAISRYFPEDTRMTAPKGGLVLWVQLNPTVDGLAVYHEARKHDISIFPGILFSTSGQYKNCIRINCGYPWNRDVENGIKKLGEIVRRL